jgi:tetratricopeptide (TPR) repeat protein
VQGIQKFVTGDLDAGIALEEAARRIQTRIGDGEGGGIALSYLAQMQFVKGDVARAVELYREAEVDFTTVGDKPELARVQGEQGYLALAAGDLDAARRHFVRAIRSNDEIGSPRGIGQAMLGLAAAEAAAGEQGRAMQIAAAAEALSRASGVVVVHPMAPDQGAVLTPAAVIELFAA